MKILLISDSHGRKAKLHSLVKKLGYSYLFFMGDGLGDVENLDGVEVRKVRGNCDCFCDEAEIIIQNFVNHKVMLTHGHKFKAKFLLNLMVEYAKENGCEILIFGHTHKQKAEYIEGVFVVNPGAFKNGDYAVLTLEKDDFDVEFFNVKD